MGVEGVTDLSNSHHQHAVKDSVSGWLFGSQEFYTNSEKVQVPTWPPTQYKYKNDVDQGSVASVDDSVSVSDSAHESFSSESSARTSWTSATDPVDVFLDEDDKEQPQHLRHGHGPRSSLEFQEHLIKGLHPKDQEVGNARFSAGQSYQNVKEPSLSTSQSEVQVQSHHGTQAWLGNTSAERPRKCNLRRSACSTKSLSPPPRLRRDTDVTEQFVSLLIIFATRLITAIWPLSACPPMMSTCFNGAGVLPLRVFIQETLRRSKTSYSTLQVALYYLVLLKAKLPCSEMAREAQSPQSDAESCERSRCRAMQCGRRMFLSALMLASKYLQDRNYSARAWSKISGLRSNEINENEREYLQKIDYQLHIPKESFDNWSKIVLALSRLSKEQPRCRSGPSNMDYRDRGSGPSNSLADMVSQVDLDESSAVFSDGWWTDLIKTLDPSLVQDPTLGDDFLQRHLPDDHFKHISLIFNKQSSKPWENASIGPEPSHHVYDLNFSDTLKPRSAEQPRIQTPLTPLQMSPVRNSTLPMQPQLRNLPTPQTTPRIADNCQLSSSHSRPSLRCSASLDALGSMRRQSLMNANLERCPPPRPQGCGMPMRSLMRPAETIRELPSTSTTPLSSSPASVASDSTTSTSRSRSSSISSTSSWSTMRLNSGAQFTSPLARICSSSDRFGKTVTTDTQRSDAPLGRFNDEGYGSSEEPQIKALRHGLSSTSEVDAIQVLMSLSSHSETPSQSVTPTPQRLAMFQGDVATHPHNNVSPRGHKRTLSKTDHSFQAQAAGTFLDKYSSYDLKDPLQPFFDNTPKQWQLPSSRWAVPRRALPNTTDNKRLATYCSIQQFASAPDLASQYLKDSMVAAS